VGRRHGHSIQARACCSPHYRPMGACTARRACWLHDCRLWDRCAVRPRELCRLGEPVWPGAHPRQISLNSSAALPFRPRRLTLKRRRALFGSCQVFSSSSRSRLRCRRLPARITLDAYFPPRHPANGLGASDWTGPMAERAPPRVSGGPASAVRIFPLRSRPPLSPAHCVTPARAARQSRAAPARGRRAFSREGGEWWLQMHMLAWVALALACLHARTTVFFLLPALGLLVVNYAILTYQGFRTCTVMSAEALPGGVTRVKILSPSFASALEQKARPAPQRPSPGSCLHLLAPGPHTQRPSSNLGTAFVSFKKPQTLNLSRASAASERTVLLRSRS